MQLVFIDECGDSKLTDYLGFCIAVINGRFYPALKTACQGILQAAGWDPATEFKGCLLFSATQGCVNVPIDKRIAAAREMLELNVAERNSRMRFAYGCMRSKSPKADYLKWLPPLLWRVLGRAPGGAGKNLLSLICDERSDISADELHANLAPAVHNRGYVLLERVAPVRSSFDTIGLMLADIVGYLAARLDTTSVDRDLLQNLDESEIAGNPKLRKMLASGALINTIKKIELYRHKYS